MSHVPRERAGARACPSCGEPLKVERYERKAAGEVELDFCYSCQAIWFDQYESAQLTPGAVMKLFAAINAHRESQPRPLADVCRCPVCHGGLELTHDIQRTNRITYYRCPLAHGRLTTFYQFLREKNFIRSLTLGEIERLKAVVKQVRCASCGAPVNLERDSQCAFCRAPIAILDADAVQRTLGELSEAERKRRSVDPHAAVDALLAGQRIERSSRSSPSTYQAGIAAWDGGVIDLVGDALGLIMDIVD